MLIVRDGSGNVFGGVATRAWSENGKYSGSGENTLFEFGGLRSSEPKVTVHRWNKARLSRRLTFTGVTLSDIFYENVYFHATYIYEVFHFNSLRGVLHFILTCYLT